MDSANRTEIAEQRLKYRSNFLMLQQFPQFDEIIKTLKHYVKACIPGIRRTEYNYWSISCLPLTGGGARAFCVNLNTMEVFVGFYDKKTFSIISTFVNIAETQFRHSYSTDESFIKKYPSTTVNPAYYMAGKNDQIRITINDLALTHTVLTDSAILEAARHFNLRLMRQGKNRYARFHCFDLADLIIE